MITPWLWAKPVGRSAASKLSHLWLAGAPAPLMKPKMPVLRLPVMVASEAVNVDNPTVRVRSLPSISSLTLWVLFPKPVWDWVARLTWLPAVTS
jgi:hypothetical protein